MADKLPNQMPLPTLNGGLDAVSLRNNAQNIIRALAAFVPAILRRVNGSLNKDGTEPMEGPVRLETYTVSTLPAASTYSRGIIYVSDETGGAVPAFSDGTNWRRVTDRVVVS